MSTMQAIKQALQRSIRTVTLRPERGRRAYRAVATLADGMLCHVEEGDHGLTVDVGKALGGQDRGPSPSVLLRFAMSSCVAMGVKQAAVLRDVEIEHIEVAVETDVDARGQLGVDAGAAIGFEAVRVSIQVVSAAPPGLIEEIVARSLAVSPLFDVFQNPQPTKHRVSVTPPAPAD